METAGIDPLETLTVKQAAQLLHIHPDRLYREIAAGKLPVLRLGRSVRIRRVALLRWCEAVEKGME